MITMMRGMREPMTRVTMRLMMRNMIESDFCNQYETIMVIVMLMMVTMNTYCRWCPFPCRRAN